MTKPTAFMIPKADYRHTRHALYADAKARSLQGFEIDLYGWRFPYTRFKNSVYCEVGTPVAMFALRRGISPTTITLAYALSSLLALGLVALGNPMSILMGFLIMFVNGALDWVDGFVARTAGRTSALGAQLDEKAGRIKICSFMLIIGIVAAIEGGGIAVLTITVVTAGLYVGFITLGDLFATQLERQRPHSPTPNIVPERRQNGALVMGALRKALLVTLYDGRARYTDALIALALTSMVLTDRPVLSIFPIVWCSILWIGCIALSIQLASLAAVEDS